ncbi:hypothetical protein [Tessaracoccus sp. OH4464_COT-324]|uniref:hypothetical protein n=1 Tax=Tessaracoccus sp. OH4464_COT-324 TaxID=2491059 RepID=UPI000F633B62|nr:hypothetical protein [Tessaracoccus sp. OH4464_COT-324]RRD45713.1 hypothetical protein EII42_10335 [Tessaracoccus sp. OH4464_COT-324]
MKKTLTIISACSVLALVGCSADAQPATSASGSTSGATDAPKSSAPEGQTTDQPVSAPPSMFDDDSALLRGLALSHLQQKGISDAVVIDQDLSDDDGHWEFEMLAGDTVHQVRIPVGSQSVTDLETESPDDDDRAAAASRINIDDAIRTITQKYPGKVGDVNFDDGMWKVDVIVDGGETEYELVVATGEIRADR